MRFAAGFPSLRVLNLFLSSFFFPRFPAAAKPSAPAPANSGAASAAPRRRADGLNRRLHLRRSEGRLRLHQATRGREGGLDHPNVKIREEEKVAETVDVQKTMESMINLDAPSCYFRRRSVLRSHI